MATLDAIDLGDNFIWSDEFGWSSVSQAVEVTVGGSVVIEESAQTAGRPITLEDLWLTRTDVETLRALVETPDYQGVLTLPGRTPFNVSWRRADGEPLEANALEPVLDPTGQDGRLFDVVLRFLEVVP